MGKENNRKQDREQNMNTAELLRKIDVESYGMELTESVAAAALKAYLCRLARREALKRIRLVMRTTVLRLPALNANDELHKPDILRATVEGDQLTHLIDTAVADGVERIEEGDSNIHSAALKALKTIHGKTIRENVSPDFLVFISDCYKALRG